MKKLVTFILLVFAAIVLVELFTKVRRPTKHY